MTPEYLAGFFDGEGTIGISCERGKVFRVRCAIANTSLEVLLRIRETFGGNLVPRPYNPKYPNAMAQHALYWSGTHNCRAILKTIRPFSIVKRTEIDLVLDEWIPHVLATRPKRLGRGLGCGEQPEGVLNTRREMRSRLSLLKKQRAVA